MLSNKKWSESSRFEVPFCQNKHDLSYLSFKKISSEQALSLRRMTLQSQMQLDDGKLLTLLTEKLTLFCCLMKPAIQQLTDCPAWFTQKGGSKKTDSSQV